MKIAEITALLVLIIAFFYTALSTWPNLVKGVLIAVFLFASGAVIARLTDSSNYYGLVIVRGKYGFDLMKNIAKNHPKIVNALADLGLSLGFGAIYSFLLFRNKFKTFFVHLIVLLVLFASAGFTAAVPTNPLYLQVIGVLFGLAGIGFVSIALNAFSVLTVPNTPAGVMPVVPGVTVPFEAIFAIALIAVVHETAHGVLFFIEKLKVKHSGALLFGFLPIGAFVEPEEKQFRKHNLHGKRRILVAGSASNFYTMLVLLPFSAIALMLVSSLTAGIMVAQVVPDSPASGVLSNGDVVTAVNGVATPSLAAFIEQITKTGAENTATLTLLDGRAVPVALDKDGKLGIHVSSYVAPQNNALYLIAAFVAEVLKWSVLLSLALSVINLLPLFITDGHQLIRDELTAAFGKNEKLGNLTTNALAVIVLLLLLINLYPLLK